MDEVLKKLKEIESKLDIILSHCFITGGKSFMDIYQEEHNIEQIIVVVDYQNKVQNQNVIDYAFKTKNFKIDKNYMVVDYEGKTYYISRDIL